MAIKRRELSPKMPSQPGGDLNLNKGARHHPNYSLNSITANPNNPRKPDLVKAGIDLAIVKQLRRKPDEDLPALETRLTQWVEENQNLTDLQRQYWLRFVNFAVEIGAVGLHQPISIREPKPNVRMATIISGERRFLAHWLIGATTISAMVSNMEDEKASMMALVENFQREEMSLEATIISLRDHQARFDHKFSMAEVGRLVNLSKGSAQGVYYAINADEDDRVLELLADGSLSKPYHLKKYFDDRSGKRKAKDTSSTASDNTPSVEDRSRSNLTDESVSGEAKSGRDRMTERSNLTETGKEGASNSDNTPGREAERSNLTDGQAKTDWENVRNFLAMICLEVLSMQGKEYQDIATRIDATENSEDLEQLVDQIAAIHQQSEDEAS